MDNNNGEGNHYPAVKQKRSWLIPLLLGMIIGILIVAFAIPEVINFTKNDGEEPELDNEQTTKTAQVNYDVTTQITDVVEDVSSAVVGVTNIQLQEDFWQQQDGDEAGTGSGVIYKTEGSHAYIVTNHHVIEGADEVDVILFDETNVKAEVLGADLFSDLAVLKIDNKKVEKAIKMGSSDSLKVGEPAIAIGNPLGHMFSGSVTKGVISGTQRTIPMDFNQDGRADWQAEVIQTDAAINPGNSGGALINIEGELIGINSMKINQTAVEGIGFAIPIDAAQPIIQELEETGNVTRPYLGIELYSLDEVPKSEWERSLNLPSEVEGGIYIWSIEPLSPAEKGGLERLDVITELDGQDINDTIDLRKVLYQDKEVGDKIEITFYRDGEKKEATIELGKQE
ncbi:MAG TPA: trypsin-like peptidase domain-containing protein [Virgibacillus sp.]|nr:trypsin-like peptidase domain-containing protein [Virgibacillus sp.]